MTGRRWLLVAVGVALALAVVAARLLVDARSALRAGQAAEGRGDRLEAIRHYQDAARLYLPASPYVRGALDRLEALAAAAAQAGDGPSVRAALEAERAAILATRSLYIPYRSRLPDVEQRLARLLAAAEDRSVAPGVSFESRVAWHLERLTRRPGPGLPTCWWQWLAWYCGSGAQSVSAANVWTRSCACVNLTPSSLASPSSWEWPCSWWACGLLSFDDSLASCGASCKPTHQQNNFSPAMVFQQKHRY